MTTILPRLLLASAMLFVAGQAAHGAEQKRITLATDGAYPPFNYTEASGKLVGFEVDLAADLCARIQAECGWVTEAFDGMIPSLNAGRFDAIMASLSITEKRAQSIDFSVPYYAGPTLFVAAADSSYVQSGVDKGLTLDLHAMTDETKSALAALGEVIEGGTIGVERASTHATFVRQLFPDAKLRVYDKEESLYLDLVSGRVDIVVSGYSSIRTFIERQKAQGKDFRVFGPALKGGALGKGIALGFRKGGDALRAEFDKAIIAATEDGTIKRLSEKWMGFDGSVPQAPGQ
ncbi:transporter substrate-binding domain-containing protein [Inquilinus limosus]|uniref:transporter substrate-binding domain-containing protein n=1 Tax=Inquilinus limosus TaxID=171674 RepID=UPI003F1441C8